MNAKNRLCYTIGALPSHNNQPNMLWFKISINELPFKDSSVPLYEGVSIGTHAIVSV